MSRSLDRLRRDILAAALPPADQTGGRSGAARSGRIAAATGYAWMRLRRPDLEARLRGLVRHPRIEALYDAGARMTRVSCASSTSAETPP